MSATALAAEFTRRVGPVVLPAYRTPGGTTAVRHHTAVLDPVWAAGLPLPVDERDLTQTVALVRGMRAERSTDQEAVTTAYQAEPRTRVYESIHARSTGWPGLVTARLESVLRHRVMCTLYESRTADRTLGPHYDTWWGVIAQLRGAKTWRLRPGTPDEQTITTLAGDVLLLPEGIRHDVSTPGPSDGPGHSVHLVFAVTNKPTDTARHWTTSRR